MQISSIIIRRSAAVIVLKLITVLVFVSVAYAIFNFSHQYACEVNDLPFYSISAIDITAFLIAMLIFIIFTVFILIQWSREKYEIKTGEITHQFGIVTNRIEHYSLQNIERIDLKQSLIGRILNFGTIRIESPLYKNAVTLKTISDPEPFVELLRSAGVATQNVYIAK